MPTRAPGLPEQNDLRSHGDRLGLEKRLDSHGPIHGLRRELLKERAVASRGQGWSVRRTLFFVVVVCGAFWAVVAGAWWLAHR